MKNKKWLLLMIIIFPSGFWVLLELSTINSTRLPYYGPKQLNGTDTVFHKVNDAFYTDFDGYIGNRTLSRVSDPAFCLLILNEKYKKDSYRLEGLLEHTRYKHYNLVDVPIIVIGASDSLGKSVNEGYPNLFDLQKNKDIKIKYWPKLSYDSLTVSYFKQKPSYVDYSFLVLIDKNRFVRGYYDTRYAAEIKRMLGEYKHLRLKEEKEIILKANDIKDKNHE